MALRLSGNFIPGSFSGTSVTILDEGPYYERIASALPIDAGTTAQLRIGPAAVLLESSTDPTRRRYYTSSDMITWTARQFPSGGSNFYATNGLAFNSAGVVKVVGGTGNSSSANRPMILTCSNITATTPTWSSVVNGSLSSTVSTGRFNTITYNSSIDTWRATTFRGNTTGVYSINAAGTSILDCTGSGFVASARNILPTTSSFITYGNNQYYSGTGTCGTTGTTISGLTFSINSDAIKTNDDATAFVLATNNQIRYSTNGTSFNLSDVSNLNTTISGYNAVAYGNGVFMTFAGNTTNPPAFSTDNGATWQPVPGWVDVANFVSASVDYDPTSKKIVAISGRDVYLYDTERLKSLA